VNQTNFIVHPSSDPGPECDHDPDEGCSCSYDYFKAYSHHHDDSDAITLYDLVQDYLKIIENGGDPERESWERCTNRIGGDWQVNKYFRDLFNRYLLSPGKFDYLTETAWFSMCHYLLGNTPVIDKLRRMPYRDFLSSLYWNCVKRKLVKFRHHCQWCESTGNLHVHHPKYDFRGEEFLLENYRQLIVLCADCHAKHHGISK